MANWIIIARVFLDTGEERISDTDVRSPTEYFEGRVLDWGYIDRSLPIPSGMSRTADAKIRVDDIDGYWRGLLTGHTARRRRVNLIRFYEGSGVSSGLTIFSGEIFKAIRGPGYMELEIRDTTFGWVDDLLFPNLINRTRFPALPEGTDEGFIPVIFGECLSPIDNPSGVIRLPRISDTRWALMITDLEEVTTVYRKAPSDEQFSVVDPGEYSITAEEEFFENAFYDFQFVDFGVAQDTGTEIRVDAKGIVFSHLFQQFFPTAIRNPVDILYTMLKVVLLRKMAPGIPVVEEVLRRDAIIEATSLDRDAALIAHAQVEAAIEDSSSASSPYLCDGAIVRPITFRAWLGQFLASFNLSLIASRAGLVQIQWNQEPTGLEPLIDDKFGILKETFFWEDPDPVANRIRYHYFHNFATGEFAEIDTYDNVDDQETLGSMVVDSDGDPVLDSSGEPLRDLFIEEEEVKFFFVRDFLTAQHVAAGRAAVMSLGSYRYMWRSPGPEYVDEIELGEFVLITHTIEGILLLPVRLYQITERLRERVVDLRALAQPALPIAPPELEVVGITGQVTLSLLNLELMYAIDDIETTYFSTQVDYNPAEWNGIVASWFEIVAINDTSDPANDTNSIFLVDELGTEYAEIVVNTGEYKRYRVAFTRPATQKKLMLKFGADPTFNSFVQVTKAVVLFDVVNSTQVVSQILMTSGGVSSGGGFGNSEENDWWAWQADAEQTGGYGYDGSSNQDYRYRSWKYEAEKWSTVNTWRWEAIAAAESGNTPADEITIALFDRTADAIVPGTALVFTGSTVGSLHAVAPERKTVDIPTSALVDTHEYETRQWKSAGTSNDLGVRHRTAIYPLVTEATRAIFYHPLTMDLFGYSTATSRNRVEQRYFHDDSKFAIGTVFRVEATAWELGGSAQLELLDAGAADEGSQVATQLPTTQSVVSGSWTDPEKILAEDNDTTEVTLNSSGATAVLEVGDFGFDSVLPDDAIIISVEIRANIGRVGQNATQCARGVDDGTPLAQHCVLETESPVVMSLVILNGRTYTLTNDNAWSKAELLDSNFAVRVQATHPANTDPTTYYWDVLWVIVGWGVFVGSGMNFAVGAGANGVRERQVTEALVLTDENRYMMAFSDWANASQEITTGFAAIASEVIGG